MKPKVVLNENVLIYAQKGENEQGQPDPTCLSLFSVVLQKCLLVIDVSVWNRYQHQLSILIDSQAVVVPPNLPHLLKQAVTDQGKVEFHWKPTPKIPEETRFSTKLMDDVKFIRLAIHSSATLVTTDEPLIEELREKGIVATYTLRVELARSFLEILSP